MQLRQARLCLDCEEVHTEAHCPSCTSESFSYISQWIPPAERRRQPRRIRRASPRADAARQVGPQRWLSRGLSGVAMVAAGRLLWQFSRPAPRQPANGRSPDGSR